MSQVTLFNAWRGFKSAGVPSTDSKLRNIEPEEGFRVGSPIRVSVRYLPRRRLISLSQSDRCESVDAVAAGGFGRRSITMDDENDENRHNLGESGTDRTSNINRIGTERSGISPKAAGEIARRSKGTKGVGGFVLTPACARVYALGKRVKPRAPLCTLCTSGDFANGGGL